MSELLADLRAMAFHGAPIDQRTLARGASGDPEARWLTGVTLGAQGRYAAAYALLEPMRTAADTVLASLACSTIGSHRRQLGGHGEARRWDSTALKLAAQVDADEAMADALLGLAADALAVGRLAESTSLVSRAESRARSQWRTEIRHGWVTAELALASGRAADAVAPAEAAARLSREHLAARHAAKSDIVLAVALTTAGDPDGRARRLAVDALDTATTAGWYSLCWPAALAAADATPHDGGEEPAKADLRACAAAHLHRVLRAADPVARRVAERSPWVPKLDKRPD
ncbi:hypothetical protein [Thermocrispum municipale]|uniref:hypothetical protein n=1 Tax=Thermocrispum municipale TaxID=37926 RepID=UPI0003F8FB76|nr:hypothetical protein [Thermocrispum municipale]